MARGVKHIRLNGISCALRVPCLVPTNSVQERWCTKLLNGEKQIELRRYAIPQDYLNQPVFLLQTPNGNEGKSTLPVEHMQAGHAGVCVAGTVTFCGQIHYTSMEQWLADVDKHCVQPGTPYSWQPGITQEMFGWQVAAVMAFTQPQPVPAMRRVFSSWFEGAHIQNDGTKALGVAEADNASAAMSCS